MNKKHLKNEENIDYFNLSDSEYEESDYYSDDDIEPIFFDKNKYVNLPNIYYDDDNCDDKEKEIEQLKKEMTI